MKTINDVKAVVREMDVGEETSEAFQAACIMAGWPLTGGRIPEITKFWGYDKQWVSSVVKRLRSNKIFKGRDEIFCNWEGVGFVLDVNCATGLMRREIKDGQPAYSLTKEGLKYAERITNGM